MFLDIWAPSSGCGFSATGILKNIAVSRHAANFLAAATINLNMPPGSGGDSPMKGERRGGYARAF
jgi:C4-dicarboxylate transporter